MTRRVPQTDPWKAPKEPRGKRTVKIVLVIAAVFLLALLFVTIASAARTGTTANGVRIAFDGRVASLKAPGPRGARVDVSVVCSRLHPRPATSPAEGERTVRAGRRARIRLSRTVRGAALCTYRASARPGREVAGAAWLGPPPAAPPVVVPGPGVRAGSTSSADGDFEGGDGDARFLLSERTLTVELKRRFGREVAVALVCGRDTGDEQVSGAVAVSIVRRGQRRVTVDLGRAVTDAQWCLIEDTTFGGDIAVASMAPPA